MGKNINQSKPMWKIIKEILVVIKHHKGRYYGKYRGAVVNNEDPKKRGRLQVTVESIAGADTCNWAEPCLPYGHFMVPPAGASVWVEFEGGDLKRPIWTGIHYSSTTPPPKHSDVGGPPTNRMIRTEGDECHEIELDDTGTGKIKINYKVPDGENGKYYMQFDKDKVEIQYDDGGFFVINKAEGLIETHLKSGQGGQEKLMKMNSDGIRIHSPDKEIGIDVVGGDCKITAKSITISALETITIQSGVSLDIKSPKIGIMGLTIDNTAAKIGLSAPQISIG